MSKLINATIVVPELELAAWAASMIISCSKTGSVKPPACAKGAPDIVNAMATAAICFMLTLNLVCGKNDKLERFGQGSGWSDGVSFATLLPIQEQKAGNHGKEHNSENNNYKS